MNRHTALLLENLDRAFDKKSWHGTTLRGSLRGLSVATATWRPAADRKCVWEYLLHAAYWKYIVRRKLTDDSSPRFPRGPSNFPAMPDDTTAKALTADIRLLQTEHGLLRDAVAAFPARRLAESAGEHTYEGLILGAAAHDLYHAGQIQLAKRLASG